MGFFPAGTYDLFLTHAWRYTDEWQGLVALLDAHLPGRWRNWSLPWYDTSIERLSTEGHAELERLLHGQISMASAIVLVPETIGTTEGQTWLDIQLAIAGRYAKPIIGVRPRDGQPFPKELAERVDCVVGRDAGDIIQALGVLQIRRAS